MVGGAVVRGLRAAGYDNLVLRTRQELDLRDAHAVRSFFEAARPDFVVAAAARVGGILAHTQHPAKFLYDNLAIELNVIKAAQEVGVQRLLFLGSACIYPKVTPQPIKEEYLLTGPLEPSNEGYALAKIAGLRLCEAFYQEYGCDFVSLMPTNLYGPGDNFDLTTSHVLPALLRKFHEAKRSDSQPDAPVTVWGTGEPRREFLFADDLADACLFVLCHPAEELRKAAFEGFLNVGVGQDLSIRELAEIIREVVGVESEIVLDRSKPDGTPLRRMDVARLNGLGWTASTSLREGLARTYAWYQEQEAVGAIRGV